MKLLLTNDELYEVPGGTQIVTRDLALSLQKRGHTVAVYAWLRGSLSAALVAEGVPVVATPAECGFVPDVIHGQHHMAAMTALCAFPRTPAVYFCHGYGPWLERPPRHPRILKYASMAEAMRNWIAIETGRPREEILILPNSVHLGRFHKVRQLCQRPRRALLYGNAFVPEYHVGRLERACERNDVRLDKVGAHFGNCTDSPQDLLPEYDLVFAVGRSALEAMACGCAVMPCSMKGCGPIVDPLSLESWTQRNFTVPGDIFPTEVTRVAREIRRFDPGKAAEVTRRVRAQHDFKRTCDQLEALYSEIQNKWSSRSQDVVAESTAMSDYLATLRPFIHGADERLRRAREQARTSRSRAAVLKQRLSAEKKRWKQLCDRMPGMLKRWLLRDLE